MRQPKTFAEVLESDPDAPQATTFKDILFRWSREGALVHWPTGIKTLDDNTGGGLVYGSRAYLMGAPDAGKTALLVQLAHEFALQGMCVGLLAIDEEDGDVATRFFQRAGWFRADLEKREEWALERLEEDTQGLKVRFYDDTFTIETAAADLSEWAESQGCRAFFGVDSVQTAYSEAAKVAESTREHVTENVRAIRAVSSQYKLLTIATSEMNRNAYRNVNNAEQQNDMAAGKESGAIEYSARVLLALRSVPNEQGVVHAKVVKNKLGRSNVEFHMQLNHGKQTLEEIQYREEQPQSKEDKATAQLQADLERVLPKLRMHKKPIEGGKTGFRHFAKMMGTRADMLLAELLDMGWLKMVTEGKTKTIQVVHEVLPVSPV